MKRSIMTRLTALLMATSIIIPIAGCGVDSSTTDMEPQPTAAMMEATGETLRDEETAPSSEPKIDETTLPTEALTEPTTSPETIPPEEEKDEFGMTTQQRNSFSMLYHLAITAEKIRISRDNRLILEDIYTSLLNDINPGAIDELTQSHLDNLRDIIKFYLNISVKRERLQYLYNQQKAASMRSAVPDPKAILSYTNSFSLKKLAVSVGYTLVDSYNNYKNTSDAVDQAFLISGWELDDEETEAIQNNRERAFDYMVDVVQEYHLDGKMTLNEKAVETFAEICEIESIPQRLQRLEAEYDTYKLLGNYWIALAECYYETEQYEKCLDCVECYNQLSAGIYRKDYNYVPILPKAIVAAQNIYDGQEYITHVGAFADDIIENTTTEEWAVRYFAAQVYLDLYARTEDSDYLQKAYDIAYANVGILLQEQKKLNETYLNDVCEVQVTEPNYDFMTDQEKKEAQKEYKAEKQRVKDYNKSLHQNRKTELPPVYEPLILNCELLFALADKMNIPNQEKEEIEAVLETDQNGVFLSDPVNSRYSFSKPVSDCSIELTKNSIKIPVALLSDGAQITVKITDKENTVICDDCTVTKVDRESDTIDSFYAYVSSKKMKDYKWSLDSSVTISIINGDEEKPLTFCYKVVEYKDNWIGPDTVVFEQR